jgi:hypothetical protein
MISTYRGRSYGYGSAVYLNEKLMRIVDGGTRRSPHSTRVGRRGIHLVRRTLWYYKELN